MSVEVHVPRLGIEFLGEAALPLVGTWVDEAGDALQGAVPVAIVGLGATTFTQTLRIQNDNDEAKIITGLTFVEQPPITNVAGVFPATVPAGGHVDVAITISFDGTQQHRDTSFFDTSGTADSIA